MLVPVDWLREYCDPSLATDEIAARLTLTGIITEQHKLIDTVAAVKAAFAARCEKGRSCPCKTEKLPATIPANSIKQVQLRAFFISAPGTLAPTFQSGQAPAAIPGCTNCSHSAALWTTR